ncbi:MAG TPA: hypothetical protein VFV93_10505 [Thermomicrobiales bacterium]|nr:hypothetical protein [Thermomicrobiales bacterium]
MITTPEHEQDGSATATFYRDALALMVDSPISFLVGGAFALQRYTGLARDTKDIDIFVRPSDVRRTLRQFARAGYATEVPFPHWLAKARCGEFFMDIIFSSGNGLAVVDDEWFAGATDAEVMGMPVKLAPVEETVWSKAFIMERERFDGADVAHLLHATADTLDWQRLLRRFDGHWPVLLSHLVLFGYIYPSKRDLIPGWVMTRLIERLQSEDASSADPICRGTYLSRAQYLPDITDWGYRDARVHPEGPMSAEDADIWTTAAIDDEAVTISIASDAVVSETSAA